MGFIQNFNIYSLFLVLLVFSGNSFGARNLLFLYQPPPIALTYHRGDLLEGELKVSVLWYGKFTPPQKSIVLDFLVSLNSDGTKAGKEPTVSQWWQTIESSYLKKAGKMPTHLILSDQISDEKCSRGKILRKSHVSELSRRINSNSGGLTLVLTAEDVAVEGFCMSNCGYHDWEKGEKTAYIWVGNSAIRCPGQCAWPFYQPIYGPQTKPLGAPNGDVGADGMIVNIASLMAGAVTNPFGNGYFQGSASACPGMYGKGAYPGFAGDLLSDSTTGASYNALGAKGRKYLLPALFDPDTSKCSTNV